MKRWLTPYLIYSLVILGAIFLQSQVFPAIKIFGVVPDLLLILVIVNAINTDFGVGVLVGVLAGFLEDYLMGAYFGVNIIAMAALGGVFGFLRGKLHLQTFFAHFFSVFFGTIGAGTLYLLLFSLVGADISIVQNFFAIVIPMTFYNLLVLLVFGPLVFFLHSRWNLKIGEINLFGGGIALVCETAPIRCCGAQAAAGTPRAGGWDLDGRKPIREGGGTIESVKKQCVSDDGPPGVSVYLGAGGLYSLIGRLFVLQVVKGADYFGAAERTNTG